tara:strand:+ start:28 stop:447 length:420 start_codon:yes stop_codon:yes gene_type:complete
MVTVTEKILNTIQISSAKHKSWSHDSVTEGLSLKRTGKTLIGVYYTPSRPKRFVILDPVVTVVSIIQKTEESKKRKRQELDITGDYLCSGCSMSGKENQVLSDEKISYERENIFGDISKHFSKRPSCSTCGYTTDCCAC